MSPGLLLIALVLSWVIIILAMLASVLDTMQHVRWDTNRLRKQNYLINNTVKEIWGPALREQLAHEPAILRFIREHGDERD
jgi:hypothetical protein